MIEIATSVSCQENLLKTGIVLRGLVAYFLSWAFPRKQQVQVKDPEAAEGRSRRRAAERRKRRSEWLESEFRVQSQNPNSCSLTQTDEFEYLFKETVVQPTEEGAALHWFAWF